MWTLIPLGNPGPEYQDTRHNLGRLMLQRWMQDRGIGKPARVQPARTAFLANENQ